MAPANGIKSSHIRVESHSIAHVRIDSLVFDGPLRPAGADKADARVVAETGDCLPVGIARSSAPRVIDGTRGAAAAAQIALTHPHWSDRAIAAVTGISDKTVARIRSRSSAEGTAQPRARVGRDGRRRPLDGEQRRRHAAAIFLSRPEAGLREVGRATGLSPATVRDVRQRIHRGEDPVPARYRGAQGAVRAPVAANRQRTPGGSIRIERAAVTVDRRQLLARLSEDPSLRLSEAGRSALRWLQHYSIDSDGIATLERGVPCHWAAEVADLARSCATAWSELAAQLQRRAA